MKVKRLLVTAVAAAAVVLPLCVTGTASAATGVIFHDYATGRCLDSNAGGDVYTLPCNGGPFQEWVQGDWTWVDVATGRCLDSNAGGDAYTLPCNGGSFQEWQPYDVDGSIDPSIYTQTDFATGRCLDSNAGGDAYTLPCNGGPFQEWAATT